MIQKYFSQNCIHSLVPNSIFGPVYLLILQSYLMFTVWWNQKAYALKPMLQKHEISFNLLSQACSACKNCIDFFSLNVNKKNRGKICEIFQLYMLK